MSDEQTSNSDRLNALIGNASPKPTSSRRKSSSSGSVSVSRSVSDGGSDRRSRRRDDDSRSLASATSSSNSHQHRPSKSKPSTKASHSRRSKRTGGDGSKDEESVTPLGPAFDNFGTSSADAAFEDFGAFQFTAPDSTYGFPTTSNVQEDYEPPPAFDAHFSMTSGTAEGYEESKTSPIVKPPVSDSDLLNRLPNIQLSKTPRNVFVLPTPQKNKHNSTLPMPRAHPLNGSIISFLPDPHNPRIIEWNPHTQAQVMSLPILSPDLQQKISAKYPHVQIQACQQCWNLCVGTHDTSSSASGTGYQDRVRVAALLDLMLQNNRNFQTESVRVICIWQWGYGSKTSNTSGSINASKTKATASQPSSPLATCPLQCVLSPPSGSDFHYDTQQMQMSDSCLLMSGASTQKGPCVFLSKFTHKETWSANFIGKDSHRISCIRVLQSRRITCKEAAPKHINKNGNQKDTTATTTLPNLRLPYVAIALTDGQISIWTFEAATKLNSKTKDDSAAAARRLLYPVCRLNTTPATEGGFPNYALDWQENKELEDAPKQVGYCTHLEWIPDQSSAASQLLLLAAAFQGGLAIYHVALPKVMDPTSKKYASLKSPNEKTQLSHCPTLPTIWGCKWPQVYHEGFVGFVDLDLLGQPSFSVMVKGLDANTDYCRVGLVTCRLHMFGLRTKSETSLLWVWDSVEISSGSSSSKTTMQGLVVGARSSGILCATSRSWQVLDLYESFQGSGETSKQRLLVRGGGIGSIPPGLTTSGTTYSSDCDNAKGNPYKDGVWHVYTTLHCERQKTPDYLEWTTPMRRHWLVETRIGDSKEASAIAIPQDEDIVLGGATTKVICELGGLGPLSQLMPARILRRNGRAAILFRSHWKSGSMIGLVDGQAADGDNREKLGIVNVVEGRDATFLSDTKLLILSRNGGTVSEWERSSEGSWSETDTSFRPIGGVDETISEDYLDCQRLIATHHQNHVGLIAIGYQAATNRCCVIAGKMKSNEGLSSEMLPNLQKDAVLVLEENEQVTSIQPLPSEQAVQGGVALVTSQRMMILAPNSLKILSSVSHRLPPTSIVPLGSYTVAYSSQDDHKIRYVSGVPGSFGDSGLIASFPLPHYEFNPRWIMAIRPDRIVYSSWHTGTRLVERGQDSHTFLIPTAETRPALLLEPMVANAIATGGDQTVCQPYFRTVIEKFGRKVATMTHGDGEGIGNHGAGMTPRVFELLEAHHLQAAASWLLTGTTRFDRSANSRLLPPWMPVTAKVKGAPTADTHLHAISNGDQYFLEYIKSPDHNMTATLPRPSDPSSFVCQHFALEAMKKGNILDAFKMFDVAGTEASDSMMLQMTLAMQSTPSKNVSPILNALFQGADSQMGKGGTSFSSVASLAALASELKKNGGSKTSEDFTKQWMRPLAPSLQRCFRTGRNRPRILGESCFEVIGKAETLEDRLFSTEAPESKLVWNEGPNREKENLLMLDHVEDWFGRRRPMILGKEGAKGAEDRGASTLADILAKTDDDSFGGGEEAEDMDDGWVDGVGEGQKDEDKLSAYFRFSEGEDEENTWREEGFADLSKFEVKAFLVGPADSVMLAESTSSVDEGDPGKVKAIYDVVFAKSGVGLSQALAMTANRGCSLDVGLMHRSEHSDRQKLTLEFWCWVPEAVSNDMVLARRTFGPSGDDFDKVCKASATNAALWDLVMTSNGEIIFRTIAGGKMMTSPKTPGQDDKGPQSTLSFGKWNHVCVMMKQESSSSMTRSAVTVLFKGNSVAEDSLDFRPPDFEEDDFAGEAASYDTLLEKSHLVFGLDHPESFRMTELRVWATIRDDDDIRTMMTEYLEPAEVKRKLRVKIKKKGGGDCKISPKGGLAPKGFLAPPGANDVGGNPAILSPPKGMVLSPPKDSNTGNTSGALRPPSEGRSASRKGLLAPPKGSGSDDDTDNVASFGTDFGGAAAGGATQPSRPSVSPTVFGSSAFGFGATPTSAAPSFDTGAFGGDGFGSMPSASMEEAATTGEIEISPLWDSAIPLSEQVRSSAAAALIRGPPATRHFGGNRGGLPDYREMERLGVGAISICGSEKTIIWRDDNVPPGLTYPIGASGAIVSDHMDEDGSEFLCCFLAKDKRMVVFELSTRTVVVELQMTTKLNYWRFLPPEAGEDTLCFMLVTPVGGFHWMPLDESPRPRQVWKRGPELQSKKIVSYEEGGTNGLDGPDMLSKVGMLLVTSSSSGGGGQLESWLLPICGDSQAVCASEDVLGACLCRPPDVGYEAWMPLLLFVVESEQGDLVVCVSAVTEPSETSVGLTDVMTDALIEMAPYEDFDFEAPLLAMGNWPEVLCCSLGSTIVVIARRKGLVVAYELADTGLELIAQEHVGHFVVDAVMRYSVVEGGAEIVLLMADSENPRDGRVGTFCFRAATY